jgi:hypothetical protein
MVAIDTCMMMILSRGIRNVSEPARVKVVLHCDKVGCASTRVLNTRPNPLVLFYCMYTCVFVQQVDSCAQDKIKEAE